MLEIDHLGQVVSPPLLQDDLTQLGEGPLPSLLPGLSHPGRRWPLPPPPNTLRAPPGEALPQCCCLQVPPPLPDLLARLRCRTSVLIPLLLLLLSSVSTHLVGPSSLMALSSHHLPKTLKLTFLAQTSFLMSAPPFSISVRISSEHLKF